jgi:accessory gene regulator protein AgrB
VKKLIKVMMMIMLLIIIIIIIIIKNGVDVFSIEYFLGIFGTRPIVFKSLEKTRRVLNEGSAKIGNTFC